MRSSKLIPIFLIVAVALALGRICANEFTWWDDDRTIHQNERIFKPSAENVIWYWGHAAYGIYIPLTYTVWSGLAAVSRLDVPDANGISLNPWVFHSASLLIHICAALAVFGFLKRLVRSEWAAIAGALVFGLHPVQVETVAWASGLKDTLCGMFAMLAVWQYVIFRLQQKEDARFNKHYYLALIFFVLSMLSKPSGMTVPLMVAALDVLIFHCSLIQIGKSLGIWVVLSTMCAIVARVNQPGVGVSNVEFWARPLIVGDSLVFYFQKLLLPVSLAPDYGRRPGIVMQRDWVHALWLVPAGLAAGLWLVRRRQPRLALAGLLFVLPMLPVLGLVTFLFQYYSTTADHYLYQAMLGPGLVIALLLDRYRSRWVTIFVWIWVLALGMRSFDQAKYWNTERALWTHVLSVNSSSFAAHNQLGNVLAREGALEEAAAQFRAAIAVNAEDPIGYENLGNYFEIRGMWLQVIEIGEQERQILLGRPKEGRGLLKGLQERMQRAQVRLAKNQPARSATTRPRDK